jgi:hypothetical protein
VPRKRERRDPVRCGRAVLKRLPLRRQWKHRIHLVPNLVERPWIDQTFAVASGGGQTTLAYPATNRPRASADSLSCLCDREHNSMLRPRPDGSADQGLGGPRCPPPIAAGKRQPCQNPPEKTANCGQMPAPAHRLSLAKSQQPCGIQAQTPPPPKCLRSERSQVRILPGAFRDPLERKYLRRSDGCVLEGKSELMAR